MENDSLDGNKEKDDTYQPDDNLSIPVWIILVFLAAYAALGGLLFQEMEGWSYFEAFYFSFISMTTIGWCISLKPPNCAVTSPSTPLIERSC